MATTRATVLLADDQPANLRCCAVCCSTEFDVVAAVADGRALVEAAARLSPDAIVTDIAMPASTASSGATDSARAIRRRASCSSRCTRDPDVVRGGWRPAAWVRSKLVAGDELVPAVWAALRGERHVTGIAK